MGIAIFLEVLFSVLAVIVLVLFMCRKGKQASQQEKMADATRAEVRRYLASAIARLNDGYPSDGKQFLMLHRLLVKYNHGSWQKHEESVRDSITSAIVAFSRERHLSKRDGVVNSLTANLIQVYVAPVGVRSWETDKQLEMFLKDWLAALGLEEEAHDLVEYCVLCGGPTQYKRTDSIHHRKNYVEGVGQLCASCELKVSG